MRGNVILGVMFSLAIAGSLIIGSGFAALYGLGDPVGPVDDRVEEQSEQSSLKNGSIAGENAPSQDSSIVSAIVDGAKRIMDIVSLALVLPYGLMQLGFPAWFALPVGTIAFIIGGIQVTQFITGRVLR